jgi:hypothetical protein
MDDVLKEMSLSYEKKPLANSALYPEKTANGYLLYEVKVNETLAYVIGGKLERKINEILSHESNER